MGALETVAIVLSMANGAFVLIRPMARLHARIDVLAERIDHVAASIDRIENRRSDEIRGDRA